MIIARIEMDDQTLDFVVYIEGDNIPKRYVSVDEMLRKSRNVLQEFRYDANKRNMMVASEASDAIHSQESR